MDIATVIGIVSGFGLIFLSIMMGGDIGIFVNVPGVSSQTMVIAPSDTTV